MQLFDITVPTTGTFPVHAAGRYIKYLSGNNGGGDTRLLITPGGMGGAKITLVPGQAYRVADDAPTPDSWTLANYANGAPILGQVVVGNGRIDDNSIAGTVQVVDGGKARSMAGGAYTANGYIGAAGGLTPTVQLWNPVANTNRVIVETLEIATAGVAVTGSIGFTQTQKALQQYGKAKKSGGTDSLAFTTNAQAAYVGFASMLRGFSVPASSTLAVKLTEPLVLLPGWGLEIDANAANAYISANFEWYEEPNV